MNKAIILTSLFICGILYSSLAGSAYDPIKTFTSSKYRYTIQIPVSFSKVAATGKNIDLKFTDDYGCSILVNVTARTAEEYKITAHDYTKDFIESGVRQYAPNYTITKWDKVYIDGQDAFLFESVGGASPNLKSIECDFYYKDYAFVITASCMSNFYAEYEELFKKVIRSIELNVVSSSDTKSGAKKKTGGGLIDGIRKQAAAEGYDVSPEGREEASARHAGRIESMAGTNSVNEGILDATNNENNIAPIHSKDSIDGKMVLLVVVVALVLVFFVVIAMEVDAKKRYGRKKDEQIQIQAVLEKSEEVVHKVELPTTHYYYLKGNERLGPFSFKELAFEKIGSETMVWNSELAVWKKAEDLEELSILIFARPNVKNAPMKEEKEEKPVAAVSEIIDGKTVNKIKRKPMKIIFKILAIFFALGFIGQLLNGKFFIAGLILAVVFAYFGWRNSIDENKVFRESDRDVADPKPILNDSLEIKKSNAHELTLKPNAIKSSNFKKLDEEVVQKITLHKGIKEQLKKEVEKSLENIVLDTIKSNPFKGSPLEGLMISNAIGEASKNYKNALLDNSQIGLDNEEINTLIDECVSDIMKKYLI